MGPGPGLVGNRKGEATSRTWRLRTRPVPGTGLVRNGGKSDRTGCMGPLERLREWRIDRMTDRVARRPHGRQARETYGAADAHSFAWEPVLEALALGPHDRLLDVGCGGGVFLRHAIATTGCDAVGVDHSRDMVRLAGPLAVLAEAEQLPFTDGEFTAVSSIV